MIEAVLRKDFGNFSIDVEIQLKSLRNVLFGVSGSGKFSILKMIAGFYEPNFGKIVVNGRVLLDIEKGINVLIYKRNVGGQCGIFIWACSIKEIRLKSGYQYYTS